MIETIETVLSVIIGGLMILSVITGIIVGIAQNLKNSKFTQVAKTVDDIVNETKEKLISIKTQVTPISEKEQLEEESNDEMVKETVMEYIENQCKTNGIEFDEEYWSSQVESLIEEIKEKNKEEGDDK